ncbi:peptidoglycan recognition protein [Streptomyces sp. MS1.AVA.1]|uniref:Peptidoglycan recognition protein n=1 Tax=Streptomyces machairae TaxID=3134109 RepID=A0ABU8UJE5_9ACTN
MQARSRWQPPSGWRVHPVAFALLGCVPGLAAVLALGLCASGVERIVAAGARPVAARPADSHQAPRPAIVPRSAWLDDETRRAQPPPRYDDTVVAVFIHHTDSPNGYDCADVPRIIRYVYAGQTGSRDWDDIGYNFLVDRCGTIYEGREGGIARPVTGAHTQGFNHRTTGIAAIGTFTGRRARAEGDDRGDRVGGRLETGALRHGPRAKVRLTSSNSYSRYPSGTAAMFPAVAGHNVGYMTSCPGAALSERLPEIRETAARLQGRR